MSEIEPPDGVFRNVVLICTQCGYFSGEVKNWCDCVPMDRAPMWEAYATALEKGIGIVQGAREWKTRMLHDERWSGDDFTLSW